MNFKLKIIIVLVILVSMISGTVYHKITINKLRKETIYWQNESAKSDSIKQESEKTVSKLNLQVNKILLENEDLEKLIDEKNETITNNTSLIGELRESIKNVPTYSDTIYINNVPVYRQRFMVRQVPFYLEGNFQITPPYPINFDIISAEIKLDIILTERKDKTFRTYVTSPYDNLTISSINSQIVPYNQSFWEKLKFGGSILIAPKYTSAFVQLGYNKVSILTGYGTTGTTLGCTFWFK